jgi:hypothetical protein
MNDATLIAQSLNKTVAVCEQTPSIWRRMFDLWVLSYDSRISADGREFFIGL